MLKNVKKAQAAMEFLMTYGWAILVVIVVLAALTYFGVLNPANLLPSRCETGETWLKCKDYVLSAAATGDTADVSLENNGQYNIRIIGVTISSASPAFSCTGAAAADILQGNEVKFSNPTCSPAIDPTRAGKGKVSANLMISWQRLDTASPIMHSLNGTIVAQIER